MMRGSPLCSRRCVCCSENSGGGTVEVISAVSKKASFCYMAVACHALPRNSRVEAEAIVSYGSTPISWSYVKAPASSARDQTSLSRGFFPGPQTHQRMGAPASDRGSRKPMKASKW